MTAGSNYPLRRAPSRLHVAYKYGGTTEALRGSHFTLLVNEPVFTLVMDLSSNFRIRDKSSSTYLDALTLVRDYHKVRLVQCHDSLVRTRLLRALDGVAAAQMHLALRLGSRATCLYSVLPHSLLMGGIQLDVLSVLDIRRGDESARAGRPSGFHASGFQHSGVHL